MNISRRITAVVAGSTLVLTGLVGLTAPAHAAADPAPAAAGASWLTGQLTDGLIHNPTYGGFDDYGLTIDAGLALADLGEDVTEIGDAIRDNYASYTTGVDWGTSDQSAGSIAKAVVLAQTVGTTPGSYVDDAIADLEGLVATDDPIKGRIQDHVDPANEFGADYANVLGQAFAARALQTAQPGSATAKDVISFLALQQCPRGFFRTYFTADKTAADQTCKGGRAAGASDPDTDATALVVLQLADWVDSDPVVARMIGKAEAWLVGHQRDDGSYGGGTLTESANTNSTGVAGWALGSLGHDGAAARAAAWVRGHQVVSLPQCTDGLADEVGAIAYDAAGLAEGRAEGITDAGSDQWRRATAQALPVLKWAPAGTSAPAITGPTGFVKAGSQVSYRISGLVPGDSVCVATSGASVVAAADLDGDAVAKLRAPAGTAERTITVTDVADASASITSRVLGATTLKVKPKKKKVKAKKKVKVVVRGLEPGESVTLKRRKKTVATGTANAKGVFKKRVKVGKKLGKLKFTARGEFGKIRKGTKKIKVVKAKKAKQRR